MNYDITIDKSQLINGCYSDFGSKGSLSSGSSSFLSEDFCFKVLGKPCARYRKPRNINNRSDKSVDVKNPDKKKVVFDIKKEVAVYTLIEETTNPPVRLIKSKDFTKASNTHISNKPVIITVPDQQQSTKYRNSSYEIHSTQTNEDNFGDISETEIAQSAQYLLLTEDSKIKSATSIEKSNSNKSLPKKFQGSETKTQATQISRIPANISTEHYQRLPTKNTSSQYKTSETRLSSKESLVLANETEKFQGSETKTKASQVSTGRGNSKDSADLYRFKNKSLTKRDTYQTELVSKPSLVVTKGTEDPKTYQDSETNTKFHQTPVDFSQNSREQYRFEGQTSRSRRESSLAGQEDLILKKSKEPLVQNTIILKPVSPSYESEPLVLENEASRPVKESLLASQKSLLHNKAKEPKSQNTIILKNTSPSYESEPFVLENKASRPVKESLLASQKSLLHNKGKDPKSQNTIILKNTSPSYESEPFVLENYASRPVKESLLASQKSLLHNKAKEPKSQNTIILKNTSPSYDSQRFELENDASYLAASKNSLAIKEFKTRRKTCNVCDNCIFEEKNKTSVGIQKDQEEDYQFRPCFCDEISQTSHPSILKQYLDPNIMEHPVRDTAPIPTRHTFAEKKFVDKTLQTSDDNFYKSRNEIANNTNEVDFISRGINTVHTDSFNAQVTEVTSSKVQTSETSSTPIEICYQPVRDNCRYNRAYCNVCNPHSEELSPDVLNQYPLKNMRHSRPVKSRKQEVYMDRVEEPYCYCNTNLKFVPYDNYHIEPQRQRNPNLEHKAKIMPCVGQCRNCLSEGHPSINRRSHYRPPPPPPVYDFSSSDYDDDDDFELVIDQGEDSDGYSSGHSVGRYTNLPYQNNEEYGDLVQELEESLQIRNKNRVQRALLEFEQRSKHNKPLERPIIDYEEASESEEPLIRKISELTEKRKQLHKTFPCKGRCCNCITNNQQDRIKSVKNHSMPPLQQPKKKPHMKKSGWQMDDETGEWYKVNPTLSKRVNNSSPPQKDYNKCNYTCTCGK